MTENANGYMWIQLVSGLLVSGVNAALQGPHCVRFPYTSTYTYDHGLYAYTFYAFRLRRFTEAALHYVRLSVCLSICLFRAVRKTNVVIRSKLTKSRFHVYVLLVK